jgi:S1-C subfamily serine protease
MKELLKQRRIQSVEVGATGNADGTPPCLHDEIDRLFDYVWVLNVETVSDPDPIQGTAFAMKDIGMVRASHVLGKGKISRLQISSSDGSRVFDAKVLKRDETLDLAILEVPSLTLNGGLQTSRLEPRRKMAITVLGFPNHNVGDSGHFDEVIITNFRPNPFGGKDLFLINRPIITGLSGGPILEPSSKVIGVAQRGAKNEKEATETEFHAGIPISALADLMKSN